MARPGLARGLFCFFVLAWHCHFRVSFTRFWRGTALWEYQPFLSSCLALPWRHAVLVVYITFLVEFYQELDYCSPMTTGLLRALQPCTMGRSPNQRYHNCNYDWVIRNGMAIDLAPHNSHEMHCTAHFSDSAWKQFCLRNSWIIYQACVSAKR